MTEVHADAAVNRVHVPLERGARADVALDTRTYATSGAGLSIEIDTDGTQCDAPAATPSYNGGTDLGTPRAVHAVECP